MGCKYRLRVVYSLINNLYLYNVDTHTEYMQKGSTKACQKQELSDEDKNWMKSIETPRMSDKYSTFSEDTYSK